MAGLSVKYYMWGYQPHFQLSAENSAKKLFRRLHPELDVALFLVGVKLRSKDDRHDVCIEPDHYVIQPSDLGDISQAWRDAVESDERSKMMYSNADAAKRVRERLENQSLARAIEQQCQVASGQENRVFLASDPIDVDCYAVSCVLSFDGDEYEKQRVFDEGLIDRVQVDCSLIQSVANEFLKCCRDALRESDAGLDPGVVKASDEELLQRGRKKFLSDIGWRTFGLDGLENVHRLCDSMNAISAMHYEGSTAAGRFLLSESPDGQSADQLQFTEPVSLSESRRLRKLLELSRDDYILLVTSDGVTGLTRKPAKHAIQIDVPGFRHWRVNVSGRIVCEFKHGTPVLPRPSLKERDFQEICIRVLPDNADSQRLWEIAEACIGQKHGTTLVVSSRAASEAMRLGRQSTVINPRKLTSDEVAAVTAIDGAVLFDQAGSCYGIGVILDGLATEAGDPARGARYNSAVRYLDSHGKGCVVLIVSEDGDVTLLPQLRARVLKSKVHEAIDLLVQVSKENPIRRRVYAAALESVEQLRFYLSIDQCNRVNEVVRTSEKRLEKEGGSVRIIRRPFEPSKEMNDSYFLSDS